jgi:electron-transferring-flavoprotein dehydrogenase
VTIPADYPPPGTSEEFIVRPEGSPDDQIEAGVVVVGAGPAGQACAIRLMRLAGENPELAERLGEVPVALIDKGRTPGAHLLSGGILRPSGMEALFPDVPTEEWPTFGPVEGEAVYVMLNGRRSVRIPTPPPFRNHGSYVVSIAQLGRWLAERAEALGVYVLPETAGTALLVDDGRVKGVKTGDKGRGRDGEPLSNFEPGSEVVAKATVLAEGTQGHLTGAALTHFKLGGLEPARWELGVKEVWEVPNALKRVIHTMGWPLRPGAKYKEFGGSFIYPMGDDKLAIGFVLGLDYTDSRISVHDTLQLLKTHPRVAALLEGGKRIAWGAKTIPSGGYWSVPDRLWTPGMCIAGDAASMVNVPQLKGIHYAMHAGIFAADAIAEQVLRTGKVEDLSAYDDAVRSSVIEKDLYRSRNMRQVFSDRGFLVGGVIVNLMEATGGRIPGGRWGSERDVDVPIFTSKKAPAYPKPDGKHTFDKLSSVFIAGNATRDSAPNHIRVRHDNVPFELALMWQNMCPAGVYEIPEAEAERAETAGDPKLPVNIEVAASNCVQCGAITAKGGRLTPPEGGDGPVYQVT